MSYLAFAPTGTIIFYNNNQTVPPGWFLCEGQSVSRTIYKQLFNAIGTSWGSGDGSTTFNLPSLSGLMLRGRDGGVGRDANRNSRTAIAPGGATGDAVGSYQSWNLIAHTHGASTSLTSAMISHSHVTQSGNQSHTHSGSFGYTYAHTHKATFAERGQAGYEGKTEASDNWSGTKDIDITSANELGDIEHSVTSVNATQNHYHSVNHSGSLNHFHTISTSYTAGGGGDTRPLNVSVAYIIKF